MKKVTLYLLGLMLLASFNFHAFADVKNYPHGLTTSKNIYNIAKKLNAKDYQNADFIIVNDLNIDDYTPEGTGNSWSDCSIKIFTEKGRENNKVQSFAFSSNYSNLELKLVEIIKPDGSVINVDISKQSKTAIDTSQMSANIYDKNSKVLTVNIPNLKIGDTVRCVSHENLFKAPLQNTWSNIVLFEGTSPIHHIEYTINAPHALPLTKTALLSEIKGTVKFKKTEELTGIKYHWIIDNVPRMFPEPQMPALSSVVQRLLVSTIPDWEFISKWYWNLCKPHMNATPEMKSKVEELINNSKSDKEKIGKIFNFVSQKIRYMGLIAEQKSPGMEPHDVKLTFENRYGVCRDKAVLLVEMLRLAGFDAYPVIIKVGSKLDNEVPMQYFNHAITCVELNDKIILMDPTNENTKDIFPAYLSNSSYLIAKPEGATLQTSPVIPADKNLMDIKTVGQISTNGTLNATVTIKCFGINDTMYRNFLSRMTPSQLEQLFDDLFRFMIPSAKVTKLDISPKNLQNTDQQVKLIISYTADSEIVEGNNNAMFTIPWIGKSLGFVNQIISATGLDKRKYPLVTDFTCGYEEKIDLTLNDPSLTLNFTPTYKTINEPIIKYNQNIESNNNTIKGESNLSVNVVEFSPKQYLDLKQILKLLEIDRKKKLIFKVNPTSKKAIVTDSVILDKNIKIKIKDAHTWTKKYSIERKILTYNGKKDFSEIKIPYNPIWEEVKILNAEVLTGKGEVKKIEPNEINVMDMPWVSSSPRYPAGKILVANLPSVEVGSTIKYSFEKKVKDKPFFSTEATFQGFSPIKNYTFSIEYPQNLKPNIYKYKTDIIVETKSEKNNIISYTWQVKNIPAIKKISSLPPNSTFLPTIMISFDTWKNYSSTILSKITPKTENQNNVNLLTQRLIKDKTTIDEKIIAIRDYVAKYIRTDGPLFTGLPLNAMSSADQTLNDAYGNNMDKAILLFSMLKSAGLLPEFILVSEYPFLNEILTSTKKNPQRSFFNNVLIRILNKNGKVIYLNDTDEYSILGSTPHENCIGLDLLNGSFITIKPTNTNADKMDVYYNLTISDDGSAHLDVTKKYYGNIYSNMKEMFKKMVPESRKRYYQRRMSIISQLAAPASKLYTNFNEYPGIEKYSADIDNYATIENDYFYFSLPLMLQFILNLDGNTRSMPFFMMSRQNINFILDITLPEKYSNILIHPQSSIIALPGNSGEIIINSTKTANNKYNDVIKIKIKPAIYSPEAYQELLGINKKLSSPKIKTFLLKK